MEKSLQEKIFNYSELLFKILFLFYGLFSFNSFLAHTKIISITLYLTLFFAGIVLMYRIVNYKYFINNKLLWIAFLFALSYAVSFLLNLEYKSFNGVKTFIFMGMEFCLLLATDSRKNFEVKKRETELILKIFSAYMFIAAFASIILMFTSYGKITTRNNASIISGFVWGRLWGVFTDPNYASVLSVSAIIILLYFIITDHKKIIKVVNFINLLLQLMYIAFSDSRTGLVTLMVASAIFTYFYFVSKHISANRLIKNAVSVLLALIIGATSFAAVKIAQKTYNCIVIRIEESKPVSDDKPNLPDIDKIGREQDIENDISNRRFALWKSAIETFKIKPIFGISFDNLLNFVEKNQPKTYLVNNGQGKFNNYHNMLFNVLAGQGTVGILIFIVLIILSVISAVKKLVLVYGKKEWHFYTMIFSILVGASASAMFLSDIIYAISVNMMLFWYLLGVITSDYNSKAIKEEKSEA